ncbi:MAG: 23S rRNA (pseudouridine(1915)-N(3))-methyltransferase RlmH [Candidatus Woesearchaeota archaeon]
MKITIIAVGKIKEKPIQQSINKFLKRIPITIIEEKDLNPEREANRILKHIKNQYVIVCSEEGKEYTSKDFAKHLQTISFEKEIVFVVGGPIGIHDKLKTAADEILSLSKMTIPHEMARLFLIEQIYRAQTIIDGKEYHKE